MSTSTLRSPCLTCVMADRDKNGRKCAECDRRAAYVGALGDLISPSYPITSKAKPEARKMEERTEKQDFTCRKCSKQWPLDKMSNHKNVCKECRSIEQKEWRLKQRINKQVAVIRDVAGTTEYAPSREGLVPLPKPLISCDNPKDFIMPSISWQEELFEGFEKIETALVEDAIASFRDPRMQVLWVLHQYYGNREGGGHE